MKGKSCILNIWYLLGMTESHNSFPRTSLRLTLKKTSTHMALHVDGRCEKCGTGLQHNIIYPDVRGGSLEVRGEMMIGLRWWLWLVS